MKVNVTPMEKKLWTNGFKFGVTLIGIGAIVTLYRFIYGLGAATNLNDGFPWGLWIVFDVVTGIALASGGFTMAAIIYIFNRGEYSPLVRPAILTAMIGYLLAGFAIFVDVGRFWNIPFVPLPSRWQGNSPLFEVAMCVMAYSTVLILEFVPILTEKWRKKESGFLKSLSDAVEPFLNRILIVLIMLGVVISSLHQSSLGALYLIVPHKQHALWHTPWSPLMFLLSAVAVGYPMVVFESIISARTFKRKAEMSLLSKLTKVTPWVLGTYLVLKLFDLVFYGEIGLLFSDGYGILWIVEILIFAVIPIFLLSNSKIRNSQRGLMNVSIMIALGLVLNRFNVYLFSVSPRPGFHYFPSAGELAVTAMMISVVFVVYKIVANYFPLLAVEEN